MVLVVIAFGSNPDLPPAAAVSPPPPPASGDANEGLSLQTVPIVVAVTDAEHTVAAFRAKLDEQGIGAGKVGLVLLFGVSRDGQPLHGVQVSEQLRTYLVDAHLPQLNNSHEIRPYMGADNEAGPGEVKAELFVFSGHR
ncbi:hypothetical protein AB0L82_36290 [Nocardia sp. NPDC052001]|uniref:hypothetical protein n=1 Tax=Nocardia sp. NPDC052001 TaxID=3154853 RepID=UPI00342637EA